MKRKKILITGGAGFIGHHVIFNLLTKTDSEIISMDRLDYSGSYSRIQQIIDKNDSWKKRVNVIWHDLKAEINPITANQINKPDIILHLAAASHVDRSITDPMSFVMDNVVGTVNLLNYARKLRKLEKFVFFSTDEVFGPAPTNVKYKENDRYNSGNPYAASKAGAEEMCVAFKNTYKMPILVTHTMNVFGERQHQEKFLPKIINFILNKKTLTIHSNKNKTKAGSRFYIHAQDVADALNFILKNGTIGEKYNIVGAKELDNLQLAKIVSDHIGKKLKYKFVDFHSSRPGHDLRYALSGVKLKKMGWQPSKNIEQRIKDTVDWTIQNKEWL